MRTTTGEETAYGIAANIFDEKLKQVSGGKLSINQFPGAQLGTEPQTLQKMGAGEIDFVITATANASSAAPMVPDMDMRCRLEPATPELRNLRWPAWSLTSRSRSPSAADRRRRRGLRLRGLS